MQTRAVGLSALVFAVTVTVASLTVSAPTTGLVSLLAVLATLGPTWLVYVLASRDRRLPRAVGQESPVAPTDLHDETAGRRLADAHPSEQQYQRLVEHVDQVIFQLDAEARWTFLNRAWESFTGVRVAAALGQPLSSSLHPDDRHDVQALLGALLSGGQEDCRLEVRFLTADGAVRWGDVRARVLVESGARVGVAGSISDVTASREVQQELERARVGAERAGATKSEFLRSMSHEMRTPLNGVLGLMELLSATRLDSQQARYVSVARASATHLGSLITDILDLSRIEAGTLSLERTLFDLPDLLESSVDAVADGAAAKGLRLSCTVTQDVPTWVIGDPGRLRQVLVNLLVNAVRFTEKGDVHLQGDAQVDLQTRQAWLRLEVQDTGIGLSPERLERLFLPFTPGETSGTRSHGGTGLGLTICKRLVDLMRGTIGARSVEGEGATFTIEVPIDVADVAMVEARREHDAPLRVLAVLADEIERAAILRLLEGWRLDAAVVGDCDAAWGHVEATSPSRWRFGIVVLDSQAPGAAGFARRLREMTPGPGVVWVMPEGGGVPAEITGVREQVARPVKEAALFDAIMQAAVGSAAGADAPTSPGWTAPPRVLVAEDHDVNQMVVRELLLGLGCNVDLAVDGDAAVAAALATSYDIVLMDCQMPVVDGFEATRRIRRAHADGRTTHDPWIIALTANASPDDRQACLEAGMDAYLTKPVRGPVLQRTLHRLLAEGRRAPLRASGKGDRVIVAPPVAPPVAPVDRGEVPDAEDILDPAEVLVRCNHNADLGARMLQLFAESLPAELEALEAAAAANDTEALAQIAHKMRGAAATLAAVRLAGAITGVELYLKYGDGGPLAELVADVRHESALFLGVVPQIARRLRDGTAARGA